MRTLLKIAGVAVVSLALTAPAGALPLFLDDWGVSYGNWAPVVPNAPDVTFTVEDWISGNGGFLDPGYGGDGFDVEALYIGVDPDYLYLAVVTGFPVTGNDGWGGHYWEHYDPGDIALDVTGDGVYDYAIDVSAGGALRSGNLGWTHCMIEGNLAFGGASDPFRASSWTQTGTLHDYRYGTFSGRYAIEAVIDRDDIEPFGSALKMHWTMGCGNDVGELTHAVEPIPEPASLLLLGGGLAAAGLLNRKRRKES